MFVIIEIQDDDIVILPKLPNKGNMNRIYKFPLGKTLRVDLDEGKVEGLESFEKYQKTIKERMMGIHTDLDKIYINGQIVEDYPATYITLHKSLEELEKSIIKEEEEEIMEEYTEVRDKNNKKIQNGGAYRLNKKSKGYGYIYRKKGGINIMSLNLIANKTKKTLSDSLDMLKKLKVGGHSQCGGSNLDIKEIKKSVMKNAKKIYNISKGTINEGMSSINKLAKNAFILIKGGKYEKAIETMKKIGKSCNDIKMNYKKGKYCGGYKCNNCKYCKYGGASISDIKMLEKKLDKLQKKLKSVKSHKKEDIRKKIRAGQNLLNKMKGGQN